MTGLETALAVVADAMVRTGLLDWAGVAERMSDTPARIGRVGGQGRPLAVGEPANLTLVDEAERWSVDPDAMATAGRNSPFAGRAMTGRVVATFYAGVATVLGSSLAERPVEQAAEPSVDHELAGAAR